MYLLIGILLAVLTVGGAAFLLWQKQREAQAKVAKQRTVEARDTVADWPPTATRIMSVPERKAYESLLKALPDNLILAQVPLSRFMRVPTRYSYGEWLSRVGQLSADLLVCDASTQVLAVIEIRGAEESPRSVQRHNRMVRVLKAAGIQVLVWPDNAIPTPTAARHALFPHEAQKAREDRAAMVARADRSAAEPIPVAEVQELDEPREPPPTTWFNDLEGPNRAPAREG
ncbi:DUF2726 domain-containing protein [Ideonella sp. DXS29W]|uniref:DUF2726 domain-containing protein n=1 Tax=Ideonella lacteola TaxID=2984193 RepID=A0ABU9BS49_9BURK